MQNQGVYCAYGLNSPPCRGDDTGRRSRVTNIAAGGANCLRPLAALSSTDFLHKRKAVVKNTTAEKVGKKSEFAI